MRLISIIAILFAFGSELAMAADSISRPRPGLQNSAPCSSERHSASAQLARQSATIRQMCMSKTAASCAINTNHSVFSPDAYQDIAFLAFANSNN